MCLWLPWGVCMIMSVSVWFYCQLVLGCGWLKLQLNNGLFCRILQVGIWDGGRQVEATEGCLPCQWHYWYCGNCYTQTEPLGLCTISNLCMRCDWRGSQTLQLYSSLGRTSSWYALDLMSVLETLRLRFRKPSDLFAFDAILSICKFHLRSDCNVTPRSLADETDSRVLLWRV